MYGFNNYRIEFIQKDNSGHDCIMTDIEMAKDEDEAVKLCKDFYGEDIKVTGIWIETLHNWC